MQRIDLSTSTRGYPILIGAGLLGDPALLAEHTAAADLLVVSNETVAPLWLPRLRAALPGRRLGECRLPDGEEHKTLATLARVFDALVAGRYNRDCRILALGGGVVGDIAGFAAACYQRGVDFVQLPTTLLAQVDASVGGKTAVNHPGGKNLIGAFHQPLAVIVDTDTLGTLPERELRAGLAEVIKAALIRDAEFFAWLEAHLDALLAREPAALELAIGRACRIKADIVALDEREQGERALLNLGHTFGHAIETGVGHGQWLHGEAVAAGIVLAAELARRCGRLAGDELARIRALLGRAGLPVTAPRLGAARVRELMGMDKKVRAGQLRLVLPEGIGRAVCTADYPAAALESLLAAETGSEQP
ncbi:MAG: 3-dehydroquinate synthase [Gammaproteobacteria bacterium]|nr:3-dehydroquinate synthase [Gammaproteobacteria bacterium]